MSFLVVSLTFHPMFMGAFDQPPQVSVGSSSSLISIVDGKPLASAREPGMRSCMTTPLKPEVARMEPSPSGSEFVKQLHLPRANRRVGCSLQHQFSVYLHVRAASVFFPQLQLHSSFHVQFPQLQLLFTSKPKTLSLRALPSWTSSAECRARPRGACGPGEFFFGGSRPTEKHARRLPLKNGI